MAKLFSFNNPAKIFILALFVAGVFLGKSPQVLANEPAWKLKEKPTQQFLCSDQMYCVNPSVDINPTSARMSFGVAIPECAPVYEVNAAWPDLPETFKPGDSQNISLSIGVRQNVPCPAMITEKADVSLMFGKSASEEIPTFSFVGEAKIDSFPVNGESKDAEATAAWTVPKGESGEILQVRISASLKNGLGGYITYIYEFQDSQTQKTATDIKSHEAVDDVCAIGLQTSVWRWPSFVQIVSARDSGARFADFSGEVTVAPGSDPNNTEPAEMDMVLETGSVIKTEAESTAIISFADMTTFCMKPFTTVIIDTPPDKESKMSLLAGKVWMNVKKMVQDGTMHVTLTQAVAGIKGTILVLEENEQESILKVIDGSVEYTAKKDGAVTMVEKGELARANTNGLALKENFDIVAEQNNWQEFVGRKISGQTALKKFGINYAFWVILLAAVVGGAWIVKKRKKN